MGATATRLSYPTGEGVAGEVTAVFRPLLAGGGGEGDPPLGERGGGPSAGRCGSPSPGRGPRAGRPGGLASGGGVGIEPALLPPSAGGGNSRSGRREERRAPTGPGRCCAEAETTGGGLGEGRAAPPEGRAGLRDLRRPTRSSRSPEGRPGPAGGVAWPACCLALLGGLWCFSPSEPRAVREFTEKSH